MSEIPLDDFDIPTDQTSRISLQRDREKQKFNGTWYRGSNINFIPSKSMLREEGAFRKYVIRGYEPPKKFIERSTVITAFGSCFAQHISNWLLAKGYNVLGKKLDLDSHIIRLGEGMVNTFAICEQLEWALDKKELDAGLWFGDKKEIVLPDEHVRDNTEGLLKQTEVLIITLGLSEIWYCKDSGRAFWRAVPAENFDDNRHGFRLTSVDENTANLRQIIALRDKYLTGTKIIFTLSPVPLMATFRDISCIAANSVSKAVLRVAVDNIINESHKDVFYFPSYELFKEVYDNPFQEDNRHPRTDLVAEVMGLFESEYCNTSLTAT